LILKYIYYERYRISFDYRNIALHHLRLDIVESLQRIKQAHYQDLKECCWRISSTKAYQSKHIKHTNQCGSTLSRCSSCTGWDN